VTRILVNARAAARPELGGVERYAREMVARLPALRPEIYGVVRPRPRLVHRAGHAWEQAALPLLAARARVDLLLCPANVGPLAWPRTVLVLHDAVALRHPEWYAPTFVALQRALVPRLARRAVRVVTVSEFSRRELAETVGVDAAIVPGGVGEAFTPGADPGPARAALGLDRPYVLTVASQTARKNLGALAEAARRLAETGMELVTAGGGRPQFRAEAPVAGVRMLGRVPDEHLPGLYAGAEAFVLPSRHEGFGLPCLEAMAAGTPVVAAAAGALPETCGGAALLADPDDHVGIADAVLAAVADSGALRAAGLARAGAFTWERAARELDAEVRRTLPSVEAR
jgi:glycosyltransferase involved in cell wall biosynthesis